MLLHEYTFSHLTFPYTFNKTNIIQEQDELLFKLQKEKLFLKKRKSLWQSPENYDIMTVFIRLCAQAVCRKAQAHSPGQDW